jgi:hypothetical protein
MIRIDRRIYKYPVDTTIVDIPGVVRHFAEQGGTLCAWAEVTVRADDPDGKAIGGRGRYQIFGTGHRINSGAEWVGSTVARDGYVWHLYRLTS